jgi:hypothetical protein
VDRTSAVLHLRPDCLRSLVWKRDRGSTEAELVTPDESDPLDVPRNERLRDRVFEDLAGLILDDFNRAVVREGVLGRSPGVQNGEGAPSDQGVLRGVGWRIGTRSQSRLRVGYP